MGLPDQPYGQGQQEPDQGSQDVYGQNWSDPGSPGQASPGHADFGHGDIGQSQASGGDQMPEYQVPSYQAPDYQQAPGYQTPGGHQGPGGPGGPGQALPGKTNGMAISALVCGVAQFLLWFFILVPGFIAALLALIFGLVGLGQIRRRGEGGRGMAIAGIVLGVLGVLGGIAWIVIFLAGTRHFHYHMGTY